MDITLEQKSTAVHVVIGIVIGLVSGFMTKDPYQIGNGGILLFMLGILALVYFVSQRIFNLRGQETTDKKYGAKWYLSNGVYPYAIFWLLAWLIIYNI
ncbi:TPA: hypothetical protein H1016_02485 [archaeon]|uniref:Uncharacterized protein n=1 Tax=Candidatus Naiadarchaeum limnaeum TaxID=2756139 RepID=A0A832V1K0_9ARCH|nr:hypothetical protein [Candidatus Naiadarchaeum limnaeum]